MKTSSDVKISLETGKSYPVFFKITKMTKRASSICLCALLQWSVQSASTEKDWSATQHEHGISICNAQLSNYSQIVKYCVSESPLRQGHPLEGCHHLVACNFPWHLPLEKWRQDDKMDQAEEEEITIYPWMMTKLIWRHCNLLGSGHSLSQARLKHTSAPLYGHADQRGTVWLSLSKRAIE